MNKDTYQGLPESFDSLVSLRIDSARARTKVNIYPKVSRLIPYLRGSSRWESGGHKAMRRRAVRAYSVTVAGRASNKEQEESQSVA